MWYLESLDLEKKMYEYKVFDAEEVKKDIEFYFSNPYNNKDELWLYKVSNDKKTVGNNFIDAFVNKNGDICKVITRGNREFFKKLS